MSKCAYGIWCCWHFWQTPPPTKNIWLLNKSIPKNHGPKNGPTAQLQRPWGWGPPDLSGSHLCVEVEAPFQNISQNWNLRRLYAFGFFLVLFNTPPPKKKKACSPEKIMVLSFWNGPSSGVGDWKTTFHLGRPIFRCNLLFGRVCRVYKPFL